MKRKLLLIAIVVCACKLNSQNYYGEMLYSQNQSVELSVGVRLSQSSIYGFLLGGNIPSSLPNGANFILNKVSNDGTFNNIHAQWPDFSKEYKLYGNSSCSNSAPLNTNCAGVTAIDYYAHSLSFYSYKVAAATDEGCFFMNIDHYGNLWHKAFFAFPPSSTQASKPLLVRMNNFIYIIGSYKSPMFDARQLYILKTDTYLNVLQSMTYDMAANCNIQPNPLPCPCGINQGGYDLTPSDVILSPFPSAFGASPEIVIVGEAKKYGFWPPSCSPSNESSGFLLRINPITLNALSNTLYDYGSGTNGFTSIDVVQNPNATSEGFIVGGYSDVQQFFGQSWMMKLDYTSGTPFWSNIFSSSYGTASSVITDVGFRYSPSYGDTYYGVMNNGNGGVVVKLDQSGSPFACSPCVVAGDNTNEFNYLVAGQASPNTKAITINPNGAFGQTNVGIQVYGNGGNNQFYLGMAAFNGNSNFAGCSPSTNNTSLNSLHMPTQFSTKWINKNPAGDLTVCQNFNITEQSINVTSSTPCLTSTMPNNGSNFKASPLSALNGIELESNEIFEVAPNPSSSEVNIRNIGNKEIVSVKIIDITGKLVYTKSLNANEPVTIDISSLKASLYFIEIENEKHEIVRKKLVKE